MSFDQDPNEEVSMSGADFAQMVAEIDRLKAELAEARKVPDGWKLVPIKPTAAMVFNVKNDHISIFNLYSAMLDASPEYRQ